MYKIKKNSNIHEFNRFGDLHPVESKIKSLFYISSEFKEESAVYSRKKNHDSYTFCLQRIETKLNLFCLSNKTNLSLSYNRI